MEDIERMTVSEAMIEPSSDFARRVMAAVRMEARTPAPIPFPWRRVVVGAATGIAAGIALLASPGVTDSAQDVLAQIERASHAVNPLYFGAFAGVLMLTLLIVQGTLWLARRGN